MPKYISPEQRANILAAITNEGMSIADAAKTFLVSESVIKTWMRNHAAKGNVANAAIQRLRQEVQDLKIIIGDLMLLTNRRKRRRKD